MKAIDPARSPLAYKHEEFLDSVEARPRILAEYLEPMQAFNREGVCDTIVFFGSARIVLGGPLGREGGRDYPIALESGMKCPRCGSRRVLIAFELLGRRTSAWVVSV